MCTPSVLALVILVGVGLWLLLRPVKPSLEQDARRLLFAEFHPGQAVDLLLPRRMQPEWTWALEGLLMDALVLSGQVGAAAEAAEALAPEARQGGLDWLVVNAAVNTLITAGRYRQALELVDATPAVQRQVAQAARLPTFGLVQLNLAEAEVNLGRMGEAVERLGPWDDVMLSYPLLRSGFAVQRAWILALQGDAGAAMQTMVLASPAELGALFAAEYHLVWAFIHLAAGDPGLAERAVSAALESAKRPASHRNAIFLAARVARARGDVKQTLALCEQAANHPHRWQGGDGLLLWGDTLADLGRHEEATKAWRLCVERDPQSVSATQSLERRWRESGR